MRVAMATLLPRRTVILFRFQFPPCHLIQQCRWKYTLSFKHDPGTQSLVFYCREGLSEGNKLFKDAFEDFYLNAIGKRIRIRRRHLLPGAQPVDYRRMDPQVAASVLEHIGRMPRRREFTVCAIGRLFHEHEAFQVGVSDNVLNNVLNNVRLRPGRLFETLLGEAFEEKGRLDIEDYRRLRRRVLEQCYVRHGIEVDLRWIKGMEQKRYVVFPKKITRREIRRCLVKAGLRMRLVRLRIIRPNPRFYNFLLGKRLPTRCTIFPAGTERTRRKRLGPYRRPRNAHPKPLD